VNRITYPDLVPAISGFTDEFFIEVVVCGILFG